MRSVVGGDNVNQPRVDGSPQSFPVCFPFDGGITFYACAQTVIVRQCKEQMRHACFGCDILVFQRLVTEQLQLFGRGYVQNMQAILARRTASSEDA